ncbi:hypothetical protein [Nocardioides sp. cx-173]|uniref:hypothetical protein n=1 Tax=Nocardioides sp. cx-173 TaxID=2898796 RepID=UPI001E639424|nr:hypothetical protein [Nocardioides sp. cx-173]MCD4526972.1 hypothetical protein [Nocardioides sp. cx-173]UGB41093.1 hypothetical protein LQ940_17190 [Nocardioides sp. cx-173]
MTVRVRATVVAALLAAALLVLPAAPASAQGRVTVTNDRGTAQADLRYQTELTIDGSGFQVVRGGFGGVYLMFGWVRDPSGGTWRPSRGGMSGKDYSYIPDAENAAANRGYLKFIAFPGSSTSSEAAAVLSGSGSFQLRLTVPGPVFQATDRDGDVVDVDCRKVTCGVITVGAHGVKNANNETFTPVTFANLPDAAPQSPAEPTPTGSTSPSAGPADTPSAGTAAPPAAPAARGRRVLTVDRTTAVAGHALAFSAQGFRPGEQVVAVLDDGVAGLGPLSAGSSGEVAGVLQLPLDLTPGTHELRLRGAASGTEVLERFPVSRGDEPAPAAAEAEVSEDTEGQAGPIFLAVAAGLFLVALFAYAVTTLRRRRTRTTVETP